MTRAALLARISSLSDDQVAAVGPYLEADLDAVDELDELRDQIELGRASARTEPLADSRSVFERAAGRFASGK